MLIEKKPESYCQYVISYSKNKKTSTSYSS
jgi:hypothetical protein